MTLKAELGDASLKKKSFKKKEEMNHALARFILYQAVC